MLYRVLCHECRRLATYCADKEIARQLSLLSDTLCERCTAKKERSLLSGRKLPEGPDAID